MLMITSTITSLSCQDMQPNTSFIDHCHASLLQIKNIEITSSAIYYSLKDLTIR
jgi:hypothetical protein